MTSSEILSFKNKAEAWLGKHTDTQHTPGLGIIALFAKLSQDNATRMVFSLIIMMLITRCLIGYIKRSLFLMLVALTANFLPILIVFALWAIFGGHFTLGSAVVIGMVFGIIVDDTIHLLFKTKVTSKHHITQTLRLTCPTIILTSLTISISLLAGGFSDFKPIQEMSLLASAIIFIAMIVDILLVPVLLSFKKEYT